MKYLEKKLTKNPIAQNQSGMSLVEILVGLTLVTLAISATVAIVFGSQSIVIDRDNTISAELLSKEGIVAASAIIRDDWTGTANGNHGLSFSNGRWTLSGTSDDSSIFTRTINISDTGLADERMVKSTVTWASTPLRPQKKVEMTTYVSNWADVIASGNDSGGGSPTGNWTNPVSLASINVGAGNSATDVDVVGSVVYVSTEASTKSKADIHAYNVSNPAAPALMSEIDVDAYSLQSIDGGTSHVFGAATGVIPDLKIVDASNPGNLSLSAEFNVITFVDATKIFRDGQTLYLGVKRTSYNSELFAIDASVPSAPTLLGSFEIDGDVNGITVKDGVAYVASSKDNREMYILDVSNPSAIAQIGYLDLPGTTDATSIFYVSTNRIYLGRDNTLYILDASNPANVTTLGTYNANGRINDIYVASSLAFLATSNSNSELQIINVSAVGTPSFVSSLNFPQNATGIDYQDNLVYVSVRSNDGLRIITSSQ